MWLRQLKGGGNSIKRKAGATRNEALRNALTLEAEILKEWDALQEQDPLKAAADRAKVTGESLPEATEQLMLAAGWSREMREKVLLALVASDEDLKEQGITNDLDPKTKAAVEGIESGQQTWQQWIKTRRIEERETAASTVANWESKLKLLAQWLGSDHIGTLDRKQSHSFKLFMLERGMANNSVKNYIGAYSGFWNWAIRSGQLQGENVWTDLKKGLGKGTKRKALDPELLAAAEVKADKLEDIRFWFGRYQGLRKEDYTGLRWCDVDMKQRVFHLKQYVHEGKKRNLKLKEGGERTVPIHSKLMLKLEQYLPEVTINSSAAPIWADDYKPKLEAWGARFAERFKDRYGFGTHDLRSYVVTQMLKNNINPYFLKEITGHSVPGLGKVVAGYTAPTIDEVREVLEKLN